MNTSFNYRRNLISNAVLLQLKNWIHQKLNPSSRGWAYPHPLANHAVMPFSIRQIPSVNSSATNSSLVTASDHLRRFRSSGFQPFSSFSAAGYSGSSPSNAVCTRIVPSIRKRGFEPSRFAFCCVFGCLCEENCCRPLPCCINSSCGYQQRSSQVSRTKVLHALAARSAVAAN